jgi:hypothetical protein
MLFLIFSESISALGFSLASRATLSGSANAETNRRREKSGLMLSIQGRFDYPTRKNQTRFSTRVNSGSGLSGVAPPNATNQVSNEKNTRMH